MSDVDLIRTRVVLARMQGEQERLGASLERTGLTDFADRADWLIQRRSPDEQLAWRRHWARLGIRNAAPTPERYARPASLAHRRARRATLPGLLSEEDQLRIAMASDARRQARGLPSFEELDRAERRHRKTQPETREDIPA